MSSTRVAVVGGGAIGAGIAALALMRGAEVFLWSRQESTRQRAQGDIQRVVWSRTRGGALPEAPEAILARLRICTALSEAARNADWVIEAVVEAPDVKHSILREAEAAMAENAYLGTTASWIPISTIAQPLARPERLIGVHFFNPPWGRRSVEVIPGERTAQETIEMAEMLVRGLKQIPAILTRDYPGFVGNRVLFRLFEETILAVAGGTAPQSVDAACRYQLGFPFGPWESMNYVGLDFIRRILRLACDWGWDTPSQVLVYLEEWVDEGKVRPVTGRGLHSYPGRKWERQALNRDSGETADVVGLFAPAVLEATRLVCRGVATPDVVEIIARDGLGWGEGPLAVGWRLGAAAIRDALDRRYRQEPADRYRSDQSLETVLSRGGA